MLAGRLSISTAFSPADVHLQRQLGRRQLDQDRDHLRGNLLLVLIPG